VPEIAFGTHQIWRPSVRWFACRAISASTELLCCSLRCTILILCTHTNKTAMKYCALKRYFIVSRKSSRQFNNNIITLHITSVRYDSALFITPHISRHIFKQLKGLACTLHTCSAFSCSLRPVM